VSSTIIIPTDTFSHATTNNDNEQGVEGLPGMDEYWGITIGTLLLLIYSHTTMHPISPNPRFTNPKNIRRGPRRGLAVVAVPCHDQPGQDHQRRPAVRRRHTQAFSSIVSTDRSPLFHLNPNPTQRHLPGDCGRRDAARLRQPRWCPTAAARKEGPAGRQGRAADDAAAREPRGGQGPAQPPGTHSPSALSPFSFLLPFLTPILSKPTQHSARAPWRPPRASSTRTT
jgi:hypothetical protein